ncbi:MAG: glycogen debranching enzyme, partial [Chlamydiia bacterium]|nr:glycogen debranching enzyme [Chlamydiia bacterium]
HTSGHDLYVAFNARPEGCDLILPSCTGGKAWHRIVDTGLEAPFDFTDAEGTRITVESNHYFLHPFTALLLQAR